MKKIVFTLMTIVVLVITANTTFAQTADVPWEGTGSLHNSGWFCF